jgi:hypothetical protein
MKKILVAGAFAILSTAALAQNAPAYIGSDGQMFYPNGNDPKQAEAVLSFNSSASASSEMTRTAVENINWAQNYSGR